MAHNDIPWLRWDIAFFGLLAMSFGIVLTITADICCVPWDMLHIGWQRQFGLTIGAWSIIAGLIVLAASSLLVKRPSRLGAFLNIVTVGILIDGWMIIPYLKTPEWPLEQYAMVMSGIIVISYGMRLYISAGVGADPRDSSMLALTVLTRWKGAYMGMEALVLLIGWLLGGPMLFGTLLFCVMIGSSAGLVLPQYWKNNQPSAWSDKRSRGRVKSLGGI